MSKLQYNLIYTLQTCEVRRSIPLYMSQSHFHSHDPTEPLPLTPISIFSHKFHICRSRWSHRPTRGSEAARLFQLRVRIPKRAWMSVSCDSGVFSSRIFCEVPIPRPGSINVLCVCVCVWLCVSLTVISCNSKPLHL